MTKTSTDAQIVGSVSFINGDARQFTDATAYLDCIRKAVDDIVFDFYGEENPCSEEDYNLAPSEEMEMGGM